MRETCSQKFLELVAATRESTFDFPKLKPFFIAQCILECGRGSTDLFKLHSNPFGMHYHDFMKDYATGIQYEACDGVGTYAKFSSWENVFRAYFGWFSHWPHYGDWRRFAQIGGLEFLNHIGPFYCPPGFKKEWIDAHGGLNYAEYIVNRLLPEAQDLLEKSFLKRGAIPEYVVLLDPGHSSSKPGARSNDGRVREEVLNEAQAEVVRTLLLETGANATIYNPDPDDLTAVGKQGWGNVDLVLSFHHNQYVKDNHPGQDNPYICCLVDPSADDKTKRFAQRVADAIEIALRNTPQHTKVFEGTNGMRGVYEVELRVINVTRSDPDGKPPVHILIESYFLNKFSDEKQCLEASKMAAKAIASETIKTFSL